MPRPSLKETRQEEILDAFMRCVARFGLDGSTLERISKEAGVGRPLLRHYLGNRDQMIARLLTHVAQKFEHMTEELFGALPNQNRLNALMEFLFVRQIHSPEDAAVFQALVATSQQYSTIREMLLNFVHGFEDRVAQEILRERPDADKDNCKIAASGITAIYFNTAAVAPLMPEAQWKTSQQRAAEMLLAAL